MSFSGRIVIIGAGNMATRLAVALHKRGYHISQIYNRSIQAAQQLQSLLSDTVAITDCIDNIQSDADIYLFSISDNALPHVISQLPANNALWLHTAGSVDMEIFTSKTPHYGVLYPMQTVSLNREISWEEVPIFIEASTDKDYELIESIAQSLSHHITRSSSEQRKALHLAAVFACNFTNHMYAIAEKLLQAQGLSFDVMKFLIRETEQKAENISPRLAQTGPAIRNDIAVINKHLDLLQGTAEADIYKIISDNINLYKESPNNTTH